jgi:hypothetical protein
LKRVLFVAEAVSLAQVVRLVSLARALDARRYQVHFASARFDDLVFGGTELAHVVRHRIASLPASVVDRRVARGLRPYGRSWGWRSISTSTWPCRPSSASAQG